MNYLDASDEVSKKAPVPPRIRSAPYPGGGKRIAGTSKVLPFPAPAGRRISLQGQEGGNHNISEIPAWA